MRRRVVVLLLLALTLLAVGCDSRLYPPPGDGPLRYRDEVFAGVTKTADLVYGNAIDDQGVARDLHLDLYEPSGDTVEARPAIVWVHGGSFRFGSKSSPEIVDEANTFARKGFVNVAINYRLSSTGCSASNPTASCLTAILNAKWDAQAAVRWLRANAEQYGIDVSRIAIAGTSAGAITALNVGNSPEDPGTSGNPGYSSRVNSAVSLSGASLSTPGPGDAHALLFHGTADVVVPYQWAQSTVSQSEAAGLWVEMTAWEGLGHVPYVQKRTEILDQTTNFLYWSMHLEAAAQ